MQFLLRLPIAVRFLATLCLSLGLGLIDWSTGFYVSIFAFYMVPIMVGVWLLGKRGALSIWAVTVVTCITARHVMPNRPHIGEGVEMWNGLMRATTLFFFYSGASAVRFRLESMHARVRQLTGLLPLCSCCKKIRDEYGYWDDLETYLQEHTEADVERKLCPDCSKRLSAEGAPAAAGPPAARGA